MGVVERVEMRGQSPHQPLEAVKLTLHRYAQRRTHRAIEFEVQPDTQVWRLARQAAAVSLPRRLTMRLVLVTMPRRCASRIPRLTPALRPRSSPFTIR